MNEDNTFEALCRISFEELLNTYIAPQFIFRRDVTNNQALNRFEQFWVNAYKNGMQDISIFRIQIYHNFNRMKIVGWTVDEFIEKLGERYGE